VPSRFLARSRAPLLGKICAQLTFSFNFYGNEAEVAEQIANGGENLKCTLDDADWILTAVGGVPLVPREECPDLQDDQVAVPWHWMLTDGETLWVHGC
jgi:hypothetical protein